MKSRTNLVMNLYVGLTCFMSSAQNCFLFLNISIVELMRSTFCIQFFNELTASACFKHYLLIFRRRFTNNNWYTGCVLCLLAATRVGIPHQPGSNWPTLHARNVLTVVCAAPPEDEQVVLETCRGCYFITNWIKKVHLVCSTIPMYYDARSTKH
jgi:hypothetical protein